MFVLLTHLAITIIVGSYRFLSQRLRNSLISLVLVDSAGGGFEMNNKNDFPIKYKNTG